MDIQIVSMIVLALFQFILSLLVGIIGFVFKSSLTNLKEYMTLSIGHLTDSVKQIKEDKDQERKDFKADLAEAFTRIRVIENFVSASGKGKSNESI